MNLWFKVLYKMGSKYFWLLVYAHDKEQAGKIAEMQAQHRHKTRSNAKIISIKKERVKNIDG